MGRYKIIYEDDWLIVADKPSGLLVIPTPRKEQNTLSELLNRNLDGRGVEVNAYPCHRLDRETSGVIVYAKGKKVQKLLMDQFKDREVGKSYIAVVQGAVGNDSGAIDNSIFNRNKNRYEKALTKYRVIQRKRDMSVLEVEPVTGRTNQIRIHLQRMGHPIVGESVYAFRKDFKLRFKRVALHAAAIEFKHPVTGKAMKFTSPVPEDMENLIMEGN
ncbi:MAG: RluA family pseudouridine synthase [Candidatus Omnitrophica bacterium]|nr:RluA family pseudouridine synthase [Candidatus Omnitrophota bacterium]